jgi:DNA mismatch repair ATPase MutS/FAD synthase
MNKISSFFKAQSPSPATAPLKTAPKEGTPAAVVDLCDSDDGIRTNKRNPNTALSDNEHFPENSAYVEKFDMNYEPSVPRSLRFEKALNPHGQQKGQGSGTSSSSLSSGVGTAKITYTPLEKQVLDLRQQHPHCLLAVECGYRLRFFGDDAVTAAKVLSICHHKDHNFQVASVPTFRFLVHARRLIAAGQRIGLVRQTETAALRAAGKKSSSKTFERRVVAMYTPGTMIDEDDPAFADMVGASSRAASSTDLEGDAEGDEGDGEVSDEEDVTVGGRDNDLGDFEKDDNDQWLSVLAETHETAAIVSLSLRANRLRFRNFAPLSKEKEIAVGAAADSKTDSRHSPDKISIDAIQQDIGDYLDILRPVEALTAHHARKEYWQELLQRTSGSVEGADSASSVPALASDQQWSHRSIKRLCRLPALAASSSSPGASGEKQGEVLLGRAWAAAAGFRVDNAMGQALLLLQRYLPAFGLQSALESPQVDCDDDDVAIAALAATSASSSPTSATTGKHSFRLDPVTASDLEVFAADTAYAHTHAETSMLSNTSSAGPGGRHKPLSLFAHINFCHSSFGRRTLATWLANPLCTIAGIQERQQAIRFVLNPNSAAAESWITHLTSLLSAQPEVERMLASLQHRRLSPKRTVMLLRWAQRISCELLPSADVISSLPPLLQVLLKGPDLSAVRHSVLRALSNLNVRAAEADDMAGSFGTQMLDATDAGEAVVALGRAKAQRESAQEDLEKHLRNLRVILRKPQLQYRTLNSGGAGIEHLIEVDVKDCAPKGGIVVPADWVPMNSTKTVNRYHPPEVLASQGELYRARDEMRIAAKDAWNDFLGRLGEENGLYTTLRSTCAVLGELDALLSLATVARMPGYTEPKFADNRGKLSGDSPTDASFTLDLRAVRHPMAERSLERTGGHFVSQDLTVRGGFCARQCLVVTGPNMGGKSSYVRTASLVALLAHIGSHVPASEAHVPLMDGIYTRMGADDDIAHGRSTFFNELHRAAKVLRKATSRSLVVLDELGRGTSTHDGVAVAAATLRHLAQRVGCATLFVTHYTQVAELATNCNRERTSNDGGSDADVGPCASLSDRIISMHMGYLQNESEGGSTCVGGPDITFLYAAVDGPSKGSYGLNVARSCGLSESFLRNAERASEWMLARSVSTMSTQDSIASTQENRKRGRIGAEMEGGEVLYRADNAAVSPVAPPMHRAVGKDTSANDASPTAALSAPQYVDSMEAERQALHRLIEQSQKRLLELTSGTSAAVTKPQSDTRGGISGVDPQSAGFNASQIRTLVEAGQVEEAAGLLGRLPCLQGTIVHGEKRGRTIGYPTANLGEWDVNDVDTVPADGIYAGWLCVENLVNSEVSQPSGHSADSSDNQPISTIPMKGNHGYASASTSSSASAASPSSASGDRGAEKGAASGAYSYSIRLPAAISIGTNPTFEGQRSRQVEAFALDQKEWIDLYGKRAKIEFRSYLRPTIKFGGESWLQDLLAQMEKDCQKALDILRSDTA